MIAAIGGLLVRAGIPPSPLTLGADPSARLTHATIGKDLR